MTSKAVGCPAEAVAEQARIPRVLDVRPAGPKDNRLDRKVGIVYIVKMSAEGAAQGKI